MEPTNGLAEALMELNRVSTLAAEIAVHEIAVDDGMGGKCAVPVAMLPQAGGGFAAVSLLDAIRSAAGFATQQRLSVADGPDRRTGVAQLQSLASFIAHTNRFKAERSAVWANAEARCLVSMLDYHPAGADAKPRWGQHRGIYPCPLSEAWLAWGAGKALVLDQEDFAALLDGRDRELCGGKLPNGGAAPSPAALITLANNLEVYSTATARRERDPNTGRVRISYAEDKGVSGEVMPPPAFLIHVPIFEDSAPGDLEVRLRVTVEEGAAKFCVQIHAASEVLRQAFLGLCDQVTAGTGLPVFVGKSEIP